MSSDPVISEIHVEGLHDRHELRVRLNRGLSILYGKNGAGKTTLLHILGNLLFRDLERFLHIRFHRIAVILDSSQRISLTQLQSGHINRVLSISINDAPLATIGKGHALPEHADASLRALLGPPPVYLPAFRSILDASERASRARFPGDPTWTQHDDEHTRVYEQLQTIGGDSGEAPTKGNRDQLYANAQKTLMCRRWFGPFTPIVRYPALWEVARDLQAELHQAEFRLSRADQAILTRVFTEVLQATISPKPGPESPFDAAEIHALIHSVKERVDQVGPLAGRSTDIYRRLRMLLDTEFPLKTPRDALLKQVLQVYDKALQDRVASLESIFEQLSSFERAANSFLEGKRLALSSSLSPRAMADQLFLESRDRKRNALDILSSGERHVLTMLFSATHMSRGDGMVLLDEPELSLHVDWQRHILGVLQELAGDRQIVACTHSPEVAAEHLDEMIELRSLSWHHSPQLFDESEDAEQTGEG
jgi:ABC-type lipoprotein export system ATPase subunit